MILLNIFSVVFLYSTSIFISPILCWSLHGHRIDLTGINSSKSHCYLISTYIHNYNRIHTFPTGRDLFDWGLERKWSPPERMWTVLSLETDPQLHNFSCSLPHTFPQTANPLHSSCHLISVLLSPHSNVRSTLLGPSPLPHATFLTKCLSSRCHGFEFK